MIQLITDLFSDDLTLAAGIAIVAVWELVWKGQALWRAAQHRQTGWFIALLILNTLGILPIIYLLLSRRAQRATDNTAHH